MKPAQELLNEWVLTNESALELVEKVQKDAWNSALILAASNVRTVYQEDPHFKNFEVEGKILTEQISILKLKI